MSLPTRERGLKRFSSYLCIVNVEVAPYAGAWIETPLLVQVKLANTVAPYAGAWIETYDSVHGSLKLLVAPYAGAWIETENKGAVYAFCVCRSLRGSVD